MKKQCKEMLKGRSPQKLEQPIPEELIRKKAHKLWLQRTGQVPNAESDWNEAKRILEEEQARQLKGIRKPLSILNLPFVFVEKRAIEPCARWVDNADIFRIIEKLSPIFESVGVILIPVVIWYFTQSYQEAQEQEEKATRAQEAVKSYLNQLSTVLLEGDLEKNERLRTITRASTLALLRDSNLSGDHKGQIIQYLSETKLIQTNDQEMSPVISLSTSDLSRANLSGANLGGTNLSGAVLSRADLSRADLSRADLSSTFLVSTNLTGADLSGADLGGVNLNSAFLSGANLSGANLKGANLSKANLSNTNLRRANLSGTNLKESNFSAAVLKDVNLRDADLSGTNLSGTNLRNSDLSGAVGMTKEQLDSALLCKTMLPDETISNRDCSIESN